MKQKVDMKLLAANEKMRERERELHSRHPIISMIKSSPNIFSKIGGLFSKTACKHTQIIFRSMPKAYKFL